MLKASSRPKTLEEALEALKELLTKENLLEEYRSGDPIHYHHTLGRFIRNEWGLWDNSPLVVHFKNRYGIGHADDISSIILDDLHAMLNGKYFDPTLKAQEFKNYWVSQGINPLTQRKIVLDIHG